MAPSARQPSAPAKAPRRFLYLLLFALLGIVAPLAVVYAVLGSEQGVVDELVLATCSGVVASAAWWSFFARYAEREARWLLTRELAEQRHVLDSKLSGLVREVERESRQARDQSFPRSVYPSTDEFDLRYNRDLTKDLESSPFYFFAGPSAVWVPARLELRAADSACRLREVRVRIIDPASKIAMERGVLDRRRRLENEGKSTDEIEAELREHLILSHVGLWQARGSVSGPICISYESRPVLQRLELFESSFYDSNIDRQDRERFPLSAAWSTANPGWKLAHEDFLSDGFTVFAINQDTTREKLEGHLRQMGLDPEDFDHWVERYETQYRARLEAGLALARNHRDHVLLEKQPVASVS
jgi:hypothetical protein